MIAAFCAPLQTVEAQEASTPRISRHRSHHVTLAQRSAPIAAERNLTIQRRPQGYGPDLGPDDDDIYLDGNVRYNSIRTFDPAPYADSGRQYPFGLDGIGGYGSDLGFGAGHDDALYDRGP